jgi:hypothetical protein
MGHGDLQKLYTRSKTPVFKLERQPFFNQGI